MTKLVNFTNAELGEFSDFNAISLYAREGDENIVGGAIGYPAHWADFTIATPTAVSIRVNPGRYFEDALVYDLDAPLDINLQVHLPLVQNDRRYVAILARGITETINALRQFETDAETLTTVAAQAPKTEQRRVEFVVQQGLASPTPLKPVIAANDCCICFVLLSNTGIVQVESGNDWRVETLFEVEGRVTVLEGKMVLIFKQTETLQTDLANLQARFKDIPRPQIIKQLQRDAAQARRALRLPDAARAYFYDPALTKWKWALDNPAWLARIDEGVRFAWAAERDHRLELLNENQTDIRLTAEPDPSSTRYLMPKWEGQIFLEVDGSGSSVNISSQVHTVTNAVQRSVSRSSVSYGTTVAACGNTSEYSGFDQAAQGQTFQINGETFEKVAVIDASYAGSAVSTDLLSRTHNGNYSTVDAIVDHNTQVLGGAPARAIYAAREVITNTWTETYWDYVTETFGINGSIYFQTWLQTQPKVLTGINLKFDRVASTGDVTLLLCETSDTVMPVLSAAIAKVTLSAAQIQQGWTTFPIMPRYLTPGRRYAWVTVTTGNHSLHTADGSVFTQGTAGWSTDGVIFQPLLEKDICFQLVGAKFETTRAVVEFNPLELENGMTEIKLVYEDWVSDGTAIVWEVKPSGADAWTQIRGLNQGEVNPLAGLPALTRLRATLTGTSDLAPCIVLSAKSRAYTRRPRTDAVAVTKVLQFGLSTTTIEVETALDQFDPTYHTATAKVIVGTTTYTASVTSVDLDLTTTAKRTIKQSFTVPSTSQAQIRVEMNTNTAQRIPFVENISAFAL